MPSAIWIRVKQLSEIYCNSYLCCMIFWEIFFIKWTKTDFWGVSEAYCFLTGYSGISTTDTCTCAYRQAYVSISSVYLLLLVT
jgi:hypothetical protein